SCETFENGLSNWTIASSGGSAGTSTATAATGSSSLFTRWDPVTVTSNSVDLAGSFSVELTAWVQRGNDSFSEDPDGSENLVIEYLDGGGGWVALQTYTGDGTPGEVFTPVFSLPADALHSGFQVRFRQTAGDGVDWDYWHVDDVCLTGSQQILYTFEDAAWTGAPGEVADTGTAGLDGTVFGGAQNPQTAPAIASNPGTCNYADFDGVDDYIEVADDAALDMATAFSVGVWVNARSLPGSDLATIVSKDTNYEFHINPSGQIFWWWNNASGDTRNMTSSASVTVGQWHHVTITYESGSQVIYLDGTSVATQSYAEALTENSLPLFIGTDYTFISRAWDGFLDEVNIFDRALSPSEVQTLMMETRPCATVAPQFTINHDNYGINCLAETISVDVVDATSGIPLTDFGASVVLDTQSGLGTWQLVGGGGTLTDATANDGVAVYNWQIGQSQALFSLSYPEGTPVIDVDVYQQGNPGVRDTDTEGSLTFSPSGFTVTAAPLTNPPPGVIVPFANAQTAAVTFPIHIAAYGQTANDPQCGIIESYAGARNLEFWQTYDNPTTGTRLAAVDGVGVGVNEAAAASVPVTFVAGQASVNVRYKDVGQIQLSAKDESPLDPNLAAGIRGATAGFVSRPFDFVLSNITDAGGAANPAAGGATGPVFIAAGEPFTATVTARDADGDATPNYGRETIAETVALVPAVVAPAAGNQPPVDASTGFASFANGTSTGTDFTWPEVGIITLQPEVGDGDYLGSGNVIGIPSGNVGRFVPHHFAVSLNTPTFGTACAAGNFTYIGQPFSYTAAPEIALTAEALGGQTTQNYMGDFFRLSTASLADPVYAAASGTLDTSGLPGAAADPVVADTGAGQGTLTYSSGSGLFFSRVAEVAPFDADITLSQIVTDADGVAAQSNPVEFGTSGGILFNSGPAMRYGRLAIANAFGSELVDLAVRAQTEYYVSSTVGYVPNTADTCATPVTVSFGGYTENLGGGDTCVLDTGAPGASGEGCSAAAPPGNQFRAPPLAGDFNLYLAAPGAGNEGSVNVTADAPDWLEYDWNAAATGLEDPVGTAVFGIF
ncbi:MAG: LamG domain-containing protein, partial [Pseudomonadota bacterium]